MAARQSISGSSFLLVTAAAAAVAGAVAFSPVALAWWYRDRPLELYWSAREGGWTAPVARAALHRIALGRPEGLSPERRATLAQAILLDLGLHDPGDPRHDEAERAAERLSETPRE